MTSENKNSTITQPEKVLFYGRTLQEYIKMFDLELTTWKGCKILDCPAGPASFVEEASQQGFNVIGCDPFYIDELQLMIDNGNLDIDKTINVCSAYPQFLSQKCYSSLDEVKECAKSALKIFAESYSARRKENRYIKAALPNLPFNNKSFDLVLCGNFLFIYSKLSNNNLEQLDYDFHHQAVLELLRVSKKEVRIYPIPRWEGKFHEYAAKLLIDLEKQGIVAEIVPVEYEILQGGNLMLRLTH